jgi:hypothetical protein
MRASKACVHLWLPRSHSLRRTDMRFRGRLGLPTSIVAGLLYATAVFLVGFAAGAIRVLLVVPRLGETVAALVEAPVMLFVSWKLCAWSTRRLEMARDIGARSLMGTVALATLLTAEVGVSVLAFHRTIADHFAAYGTPAGLVGLAAQVLFASFPLIEER